MQRIQASDRLYNLIRLEDILTYVNGKLKENPKFLYTGGIQKETSQRPWNRNQSEVLALAVEALAPLRHKAVNGCLVKFLGLCCEPVLHVLLDVVVIRGESFAPQSLFWGPKMA